MAATQKTLKPTNEVISIPAFADKPDYRLPIDSTGKIADAVNELYDKIIDNWNVAGTITENNASVTIPNNTKRISLRYEKDYIKCEGTFNIATNGSAYLGFLHNNLTTIVVFQSGTTITYNAVRDRNGNNLSSYSIEVRTSSI